MRCFRAALAGATWLFTAVGGEEEQNMMVELCLFPGNHERETTT
jgi:hypothetical protein